LKQDFAKSEKIDIYSDVSAYDCCVLNISLEFASETQCA